MADTKGKISHSIELKTASDDQLTGVDKNLVHSVEREEVHEGTLDHLGQDGRPVNQLLDFKWFKRLENLAKKAGKECAPDYQRELANFIVRSVSRHFNVYNLRHLPRMDYTLACFLITECHDCFRYNKYSPSSWDPDGDLLFPWDNQGRGVIRHPRMIDFPRRRSGEMRQKLTHAQKMIRHAETWSKGQITLEDALGRIAEYSSEVEICRKKSQKVDTLTLTLPTNQLPGMLGHIFSAEMVDQS